jgi:CTP:molybdopterin cytidylyltransferase MocA
MQVGLILAAGSGSRMGRPKAIIEIDGERLVDRAVSIFHDAGINKVYVVLGAWQGLVPGSIVVINPNWETGMSSSLAVGLEAISENLDITEVVISLVDLPGMTSVAIQKVAESAMEIVMGGFDGKPGHPVKFARKYWQAIIDSAEGDSGARKFLEGREDICYIQLDSLATGSDVDTPSELERFNHN